MSCDLELEITRSATPSRYIVAIDSPAGTASGEVRLDTKELLSRRRELASAVLASAVPTRGGLSAQELPVREIGRQLFEAVFADRVYGRYTASLQEAARQGEPMRVVLRLRAQELAALPWEAMFDPEADEYLCQREPIVRYVETAQPATPLPVHPPLRVLGLVSAPRDLPALNVAEEQRRLTEAIGELGKHQQVELTWVPRGTWPGLQEALLEGRWHVLHFIGHGGVDHDVGVLALEDELSDKTNLVSSARFARLLHACRPVPRLVVLNSCQSGEAAGDLLSSTAAALVQSGISASVAMQFVITDPAALAFSRGFYQALAHNRPVDEAVRLGRIAIDGTSENTLEWVTPVLFLRTGETRLFTVSKPKDSDTPAQPVRPSPEDASRESTLRGLYMQALAAMRTGRHAEAITLLDSLLALKPDYEDAADRRDAARRSQRSAASYQRGRTAEDAGNWASAVAEYTAVIDSAPDYRDAATRLADCTRRQQTASLLAELRMHAHAREWRAVMAVSDELAALGVKSAEADRAVKTARQQIRRETEASGPGPEPPERPGLAARLAPMASARLRREQRREDAGASRPKNEYHFAGGGWKIIYTSHFPLLGSVILIVPLFILAMIFLSVRFATASPYWAIVALGLAGIAGSVIDYQNGSGIWAAAIGANCAILSGCDIYGMLLTHHPGLGEINTFITVLCVTAAIGVIVNGIIITYILHSSGDRDGRSVYYPLLAFLAVIACGHALVFTVSALTLAGRLSQQGIGSLFKTAGVVFAAALLAELTAIALALVRVLQNRPRARTG